MFRKIFYCTLPDIGGFLPTALLGRIFVQHLTLADFFPKPDFGGLPLLWQIFFSPICLSRIFYKAFHIYIDSSGSSGANTTYTEPDRFKPTEVHMGFKSVTFFTSVRCVGCEYTAVYRAHPLAPLWHFRRINKNQLHAIGLHTYTRITSIIELCSYCPTQYIVRDHTLHMCTCSSSHRRKIEKSKLMDLTPCPSP